MYPSGELTRLAARKTLLQARIAVRRWECAAAATELARPIALVDRGLELWQRFAPVLKLLGVPVTFLLMRKFGRRRGTLREKRRSLVGTVLKMLPLILRGVKTFMAFRATQEGRVASTARPRREPSPAAT